jgi:hypothetical protein
LLYALVMNGKAAAKTAKHIDLYTKKKLLIKFDSLKDLAAWSYWNASVFESSLRCDVNSLAYLSCTQESCVPVFQSIHACV